MTLKINTMIGLKKAAKFFVDNCCKDKYLKKTKKGTKIINISCTNNEIKTQMGREWLQGALNKTGFDSIKPNNFKPNEFIKALDDLDSSGDSSEEISIRNDED